MLFIKAPPFERLAIQYQPTDGKVNQQIHSVIHTYIQAKAVVNSELLPGGLTDQSRRIFAGGLVSGCWF